MVLRALVAMPPVLSLKLQNASLSIDVLTHEMSLGSQLRPCSAALVPPTTLTPTPGPSCHIQDCAQKPIAVPTQDPLPHPDRSLLLPQSRC